MAEIFGTKRARSLLQKKSRDSEGLFLAEGLHLFEEAVRNSAGIVSVFATASVADDVKPKVPPKAHFEIVDEKAMRQISDAETPQGVVSVVRKAEKDEDGSLMSGKAVLVLCDGIQDPGNLGTIIRTSAAFGCSAVICAEGCADAYSPKTVRSTQGAIFGIPVITGRSTEEIVALLARLGIKIYGTSSAEGENLEGFCPELPCCVALGSEANGLSKKVAESCIRHIRIPLSGSVESLNVSVAAGIILSSVSSFR